jgi:hypothetical protein
LLIKAAFTVVRNKSSKGLGKKKKNAWSMGQRQQYILSIKYFF